MKKIKSIIVLALLLLSLLFIHSCGGGGHVTVGVGVYVPGAWGPGYGGGYYPPVGIGYPVY
jgi:hypothetical protein